MRAGSLNQCITLEQRVEGEDAAGQPYDYWDTVGTVWAAVHPIRGRELIAADAVTSITDVRVILRWRPGLTPAMRIRHGDDTYNIASVIHVRSEKREVELLCKLVQ